MISAWWLLLICPACFLLGVGFCYVFGPILFWLDWRD